MRTLRLTAPIVFFVLMLAAWTGLVTANTAPPGLSTKTLHPRWHLVTDHVNTVVSGGRYLALTTLYNDTSLYNKQTKTRTPLDPPGCLHDHGVDGFGGPWLALDCIGSNGEQVDLYGLATGTWKVVLLAPEMCDQSADPVCGVFGVGTTWIRFAVSSGFQKGGGGMTYLQNIATSAVQVDPANEPGAGVQDDLNAPSGIGTPCATLASSAFSAPFDPGSFPPTTVYWHPFGNYVLTTGVAYDEGGQSLGRLYKCGSGLLLRLPLNTFVSTQAAVWQQIRGPAAPSLDGRYLPTLRSFTIPRPKGRLVAFSNRTVYTLNGARLWAGTFR